MQGSRCFTPDVWTERTETPSPELSEPCKVERWRFERLGKFLRSSGGSVASDTAAERVAETSSRATSPLTTSSSKAARAGSGSL